MKRVNFKFKSTALVLLALGLSSNLWGANPTLSDLTFGTPIVDENFNSLSTCDKTAKAAVTTTTQTAFGVFNCIYNNNTSNHYGIASNSTYESNILSLKAGSTSPLIAHITDKTFGEKGAYRVKTDAGSKCYIGIYAEKSGTLYAKAKSSVLLYNNAGELSINSGGGWVSIGSYSSIIDICVIYNNTTSSATYGNSISLTAKTAHVYVNGNCIMDGNSPKAFTIPGATLSTFRVAPLATNGYLGYIDDLTIYNTLPTAASSGYEVTATLTNCSVTGTAIPSKTSSGFSTTITANTGYTLPSAITVSGASHTWDASTGALTISDVTGTVSITIAAEATIYLNLNSFTSWENDGVSFRVWDGTANRVFTKVSGDCSKHMYTTKITANPNATLYFKRFDGSSDYNETQGTFTTTNNMMTITGWTAGSMSAYTPYYTISFNKNGHGSANPADQCVVSGGKATTPSGLSATGWTLEGWYENVECTGTKWNFSTNTITSDKELFAHWVEDLSCAWTLHGSWNSYSGLSFVKKTGESEGFVAYYTQSLSASTTYNFKVVSGGTWYGCNPGTTPTASFSNYEFKTGDENKNCPFTTTVEGDYIFKIDFSGSNPKVSVTYPTAYTVSLTVKEAGYGSFTPATTSYDVLSGTSISTNQSARTLTIGSTTITANAASQTTEWTYTFDNWSWTPSGSTITAATTATATFTRSARMYAVTKTLTNVTANPAIGTEVAYGGSISTTISPAPGYALPESITISGGTSSWNQSTGALSITNVTGAVSITIVGVQLVDKYVDNLHGNGTTEKTGSYEAPSLIDNSGGEGECQTGHSHFAGWSTTTSSTGVDDTSKVAGFFAAGTAKTATGATYYAVWAKAQ